MHKLTHVLAMTAALGFGALGFGASAAMAAEGAAPAPTGPNARMSFFITSVGPGEGGNLGGLKGADAHCSKLAEAAGVKGKTWRAYLSTQGRGAVNARDRIGKGPWANYKGVNVAWDVDNLHSAANNVSKATALTEKGEMVNGRGDTPNRHDILTGSTHDGLALGGDADQTCKNWTSNNEGAAMAGHHDRIGGGNFPTSWNAAHAGKGCSQEALRGTGGDGLFYCFAAD